MPFSPVDLHLHSTASDGTLEPAVLVARVAAAGVRVMALTDHDTLAGLAPARAAARGWGICLVDGIELTAAWRGRVLHIVGLGIDPASPVLSGAMAELKERRRERARRIGEKLTRFGIEGAYEGARRLAGGGVIARPHFARHLVACGHAADTDEAFRRYLKKGRPGYVATEWPELEQVIGWIHAAVGRAVLAHPMRYRLTGAWLRRLLAAFTEAGGEALEVSCGSHTRQEFERCLGLARRFGLMGSLGSDWHGGDSPWSQPGRIPPLPGWITPVWQDWWEPARIEAIETGT